MARFGQLLVSILLASTSILTMNAWAKDDEKAIKIIDDSDSRSCEDLLDDVIASFEAKSAGTESLYIDQIIANDRPSFSSLIDPDPEKNLFARAPLNAMNAGQRILSFVLSGGVEKRKIGFLKEPVTVYPFLSDGTDLTKGYRVEGNWEALQEWVSFMTSAAEGHRSGRTVPILYGPGGTGKSETRTVLEKGGEVLTVQDPRFFLYSFDWVGMSKLPEIVKRWGPDVDVIPAPQNTSPIAILPPSLQEQALKMASIKGQDMLDGIRPAGLLTPDYWSQNILRIIIEKYTADKGSPLTLKETLQALSKHVQLRRYAIAASYRQMPVINVQGIDSDQTQLFVSSMPVVQAISPQGKRDPFAYSYSGIFFDGMMNATFMEEAFRSDPKFLEKIMDGLESREFQASGAAKVPWDSFVTMISNKESYDLMLQKPGLGALMQRLQKIEMVQPVQSQLIARTLLYEFKDSLFMQPVGDESAPWVKGDVDKLFPIPEKLEPGYVVGPERRYRMRIGEGKAAIEIAPHALRFVAHIMATTRLSTDKDKAFQLVPTRMTHDHIFTDPIQRMRYWDGKLTDVQPEERRTLDEMTNKLDEGHHGIFHRWGRGWLRKALSVVKNDAQFENTLTASVLLKVYEEYGFRADGFIQIEGDRKKEAEYKRLGRLVLKELLIPTVEEDINFAIGSETASISQIYDDVLQELVETGKNENATTYVSKRTNKVTNINKERVAFIRQHYKKNNSHDLDMTQVLFFHMNQLSQGEKNVTPSPEITAGLSAYLAKKTVELAKAAGYGEIARDEGTGSKEEKARVNALVKQLEGIGYNRAAALDAFDLHELTKQPTEAVQ
ncbi:MAG: hypothetical protein KF799_11680 [Bdellovibrionales bacterium]|nr:hypothetical protein [Bdellovibrionales bacterium]